MWIRSLYFEINIKRQTWMDLQWTTIVQRRAPSIRSSTIFLYGLIIDVISQNKLCALFIGITTCRTHLSHCRRPCPDERLCIWSFNQAKRNYRRQRTFDKAPHILRGKSIPDEGTSKKYRKPQKIAWVSSI